MITGDRSLSVLGKIQGTNTQGCQMGIVQGCTLRTEKKEVKEVEEKEGKEGNSILNSKPKPIAICWFASSQGAVGGGKR